MRKIIDECKKRAKINGTRLKKWTYIGYSTDSVLITFKSGETMNFRIKLICRLKKI